MDVAVLMMNQGRGSGTVARQHAQALMSAGHNVTFIVPRNDRPLAGAVNPCVDYTEDALAVHEYLPRFRSQRRVPEMGFVEGLTYAADLASALENHASGADLIIAHHVSVTTVAAARVAQRRRIPFVVFAHGTGIEPRYFGGYDDALWSLIVDSVWSADGVLVTTDYVRDELVRPLIDVPSTRFLVLPIGVDLDVFAPGRESDICRRYGIPDRYVISPGAVTALKGAQNVVSATRQYADLAPTIFIGAGDLTSTLEVEIGRRGRFLGHVTDCDKTDFINCATLLAAGPNKKEHFGIIYAEALAAGTVPVAYRGGGVDSIITEDVGVLTTRDPEDLGVEVARLLHDELRRAEMAVAARDRAEKCFDRGELDRRLVEWVESLGGLR